MGCTTSKAVQTNAPPLRIRTESEERNAPLTSEEISERIDSPETIRTFQVNDTLSISYAWYSFIFTCIFTRNYTYFYIHYPGYLNGDIIQMQLIKRIKIRTV